MAQASVSPLSEIESSISASQFGRVIFEPLSPASSEASCDYRRLVDDALLLLTHAAEIGIDVDETTRTSVLKAKAATSSDWNSPGAPDLLAALSKLAAKLHPVTADSLRASTGNLVNPDIQRLRMWTSILAAPIILFSVLGFITASLSTGIRADIATANELVVKLRAELGTPTSPTAGNAKKPALPQGLNEGDVITQLQLYASTVRAIDARSRQLNGFIFNEIHDPYARYRWNPKLNDQDRAANLQTLRQAFQLPVGVPNMPQALDNLTNTYQNVRSFAQETVDLVSVWYGAMTACFLPILYALLGTCAYLLRSFEEELKTLTFLPAQKANWARFLIAGIGGGVVGLFNFALAQGASISPLAIAFLVGYAVDVFFTFLEGFLLTFTKGKNPLGTHLAGSTPVR